MLTTRVMGTMCIVLQYICTVVFIFRIRPPYSKYPQNVSQRVVSHSHLNKIVLIRMPWKHLPSPSDTRPTYYRIGPRCILQQSYTSRWTCGVPTHLYIVLNIRLVAADRTARVADTAAKRAAVGRGDWIILYCFLIINNYNDACDACTRDRNLFVFYVVQSNFTYTCVIWLIDGRFNLSPVSRESKM